MKIYTKKGDKGTTALFGGKRLPKHHLKIDAYGTVDELMAHIGLIHDLTTDKHVKQFLITSLDRLFTLGSILATDVDKLEKLKLPEIYQTDIDAIEKEIDTMNEELPPMKAFILPGGHQTVSQCHIARCVCRRAERKCVALNEIEPVNPLILQYLNRFSDYLFVLSRFLAKKLNAQQIEWHPKKA